MKKYFYTLICFSLMLELHAQTEKIGINTSSPEETVHVIGDIILLESPDGAKKVMLRTEGASGELKSIGDLYLRAQGNEILLNHVATDGNVAIGKTGPTEKLDVAGAIRLGASDNMSSAEGTVKFESGDFQGFDGTEWKSLTSGGGVSPWMDAAGSIYYNGRVGVNTSNVNADLHVVGDTLLLESPDGTKKLLLRNAGADSEVKSIGDLYLRGQNSDVIINHVATDGNVGIGTITPEDKLDLVGNIRLTGSDRIVRHPNSLNFQSYTSDSAIVMVTPLSSSSGGDATLLLSEDNDGTFGIGMFYDGVTNNLQFFGKTTNSRSNILALERDSKHAYFYDQVFFAGLAEDEPSVTIEFDDSNPPPFNNLIRDGSIVLNSVVTPPAVDPGQEPENEVIPMMTLGGSEQRINLYNTKHTITNELSYSVRSFEAEDMGSRIDMYGFSGFTTDPYRNNVSIEANDNPNEGAKMYLRNWVGDQAIILDADLNGNARVTTDEILIKGGSDLAEYFDIEEKEKEILAGHVVVIDPRHPGKLTASSTAYDRKVVGVVSGANGIKTGFMMGQDESIATGDFPVALTGRVYVYANNENGEIKPGDFLTTSAIAGEAMKVIDFEVAQGSIIGKAMTQVDENGFVLVLVNLQ